MRVPRGQLPEGRDHLDRPALGVAVGPHPYRAAASKPLTVLIRSGRTPTPHTRERVDERVHPAGHRTNASATLAVRHAVPAQPLVVPHAANPTTVAPAAFADAAPPGTENSERFR